MNLNGCAVYPGIEAVPAALPTLVFLHGTGERGADPDRLRWHGPLRYTEAGSLPSEQALRVVAPQCPANARWGTEQQALRVGQILRELRNATYVDATRLYLTGWSMGGYGVCSVLWRMADRDLVAAAAIVSGGVPQGAPEDLAARLATIPCFIAYGLNDSTVKPKLSDQLVQRLGGAGPRRRVKTYNDANGGKPSAHVLACAQAFSTPLLYSWLLSHSRPG